MNSNPRWAWLDGKFVPWDEARVHVRTECVMRGGSVFEGIRAYWDEQASELWVFHLNEHLDRLFRSAKMLRMTVPYTKADLWNTSVELLRSNEFREDVHFRPMIYFGEGESFAFEPDKIHVGAFMTAVPHRSRQNPRGVACCISSWQRISDHDMPPRIKCTANYVNSRLAIVQARLDGYDNAILLNGNGKVAEGADACIVLIRDGVAITPTVTSGLLESITRATIIRLFREELKVEVIEREVDRTELYVADEVFFCGTHQEITPVTSVDRHIVGSGSAGVITARLQTLFYEIVGGRRPDYSSWLTPVYAARTAAQA